jgi:hypothetical protein
MHYETTVGMSNFLVPPFAFGISTCFTGGWKYDLDDIRFHRLYKFLDRFCSNIAMVSSSMLAASRLALPVTMHHLPDFLIGGLFPSCSLPRLWTAAALGGLKPTPASRLREDCPNI